MKTKTVYELIQEYRKVHKESPEYESTSKADEKTNIKIWKDCSPSNSLVL